LPDSIPQALGGDERGTNNHFYYVSAELCANFSEFTLACSSRKQAGRRIEEGC
jgi:hypothetical protein